MTHNESQQYILKFMSSVAKTMGLLVGLISGPIIKIQDL